MLSSTFKKRCVEMTKSAIRGGTVVARDDRLLFLLTLFVAVAHEEFAIFLNRVPVL